MSSAGHPSLLQARFDQEYFQNSRTWAGCSAVFLVLNVVQDMEYPHNYSPNVSLFPKKRKMSDSRL